MQEVIGGKIYQINNPGHIIETKSDQRNSFFENEILFLFFFQASERAGCLNPRIWLAKPAHVTSPAFDDTTHGPDFFPAVAIYGLKKRHPPQNK